MAKLAVANETFFQRFGVWFATSIRFGLNLLLVIVTLTLFVGILKSGADLWHSLHQPLQTVLQEILLDTVFILALTEISLTILDYLQEGRVRVRYIVDTVLIIMLNEIVAIWFHHPSLPNAIGLSVVVGTLAAVRLTMTRFTPVKKKK